MALCSLDKNITRASNCQYVLNEISEIYLTDFANASGVTASNPSGSCSGGTEATIDSGITWYKIEVAKGSASFTDELVVEDYGKYRTHTLTFNTVGSFNACMNKALNDLSLGKYVAIVKTASGNILLGRTLGLEATTATLAGGNDQNGMQIVLAGNATEEALPVPGTFKVAAD